MDSSGITDHVGHLALPSVKSSGLVRDPLRQRLQIDTVEVG
jgi:hypothetical protein